MKPIPTLCLTVLLVAACAPAAAPPVPAPAPDPHDPALPLDVRLEALFGDTAFAHATWGVVVRSLDGARTLYRRDGERMVMPASNMKTVTSAAAMHGLGAAYRYRTPFAAAGEVRDGVLMGDLVIRGSGDPTLSERFHEEPLEVARAWADSLRARGIVRIAGDVVGVTEGFDGAPYGRGWSWDYLQRGYAAGIGALTLEESTLWLEIDPGPRPGSPAEVRVAPTLAAQAVRVEAVTGVPAEDATIDAVHDADGALVVTGVIPHGADRIRRIYAVGGDPNRFFVETLARVLAAEGIRIDGGARTVPLLAETAADPAALAPLFEHRSPPLDSIVRAFMLPSQNQMAELVFRTLGLELGERGSVAEASAVVDSLLRAHGYAADELIAADGSGLSRYNLLTADLMADLLVGMAAGPHRDVWHTFFPVAGESGTLSGRMRGTPLEGRVWAKTGTVSNVRALSGYVETVAGDTLVFSMIASHHRRSAADVDRMAETALEMLHAVGSVAAERSARPEALLHALDPGVQAGHEDARRPEVVVRLDEHEGEVSRRPE